jgi:hypothetical protein
VGGTAPFRETQHYTHWIFHDVVMCYQEERARALRRWRPPAPQDRDTRDSNKGDRWGLTKTEAVIVSDMCANDRELEDQRASKKAKVSEGRSRRKNEDKAKATLDAIVPPRVQNGRQRR